MSVEVEHARCYNILVRCALRQEDWSGLCTFSRLLTDLVDVSKLQSIQLCTHCGCNEPIYVFLDTEKIE